MTEKPIESSIESTRGSSKESTMVALEKESITKLYEYLDIMKQFEKPLALVMRRRHSPDEMLESEGRKCIIAVSGLKFHNLTLYFQMSELSIVQVNPYDGYDTFIQIPIRAMNQFLRKLLSGEVDAFGMVITEEGVKFRGKKTIHDMAIFTEVCELLAQNIRRLKEI